MTSFRDTQVIGIAGQISVPYGKNYAGEKSGPEDDIEFYIGNGLRKLTEGEVELAEKFIKKNYPQARLEFGTTFVDAEDPLLKMTHQQLDKLEEALGISSKIPGGGIPLELQRVLFIRESGYKGDGKTPLPGAKATA